MRKLPIVILHALDLQSLTGIVLRSVAEKCRSFLFLLTKNLYTKVTFEILRGIVSVSPSQNDRTYFSFCERGRTVFRMRVHRSESGEVSVFFIFSERGKTVFRTRVLRSESGEVFVFPLLLRYCYGGLHPDIPLFQKLLKNPSYLSRIPQTNTAP